MGGTKRKARDDGEGPSTKRRKGELSKEDIEAEKDAIERAKYSPQVWMRFMDALNVGDDAALWKKFFFIGTELHIYPGLIVGKNWDFSHLEEDLDGKFKNKVVYMFGSTEGSSAEKDGVTYNVDLVPVVNVVCSSLPPPDKVAVTSLQLSKEIVHAFRAWNLAWVPTYPTDSSRLDKVSSRTFHLAYVPGRGARIPSEERIRDYQYLLPWVLTPKALEKFVPEDDVNFSMEFNGRVYAMDFNLDCDTIKQRAPDLCEEHGLPSDKAALISEELKKQVEIVKSRNRLTKEKIQKQLDAMNQDQIDSLRNMTLYKYYPRDYTAQMARSHYMNRTYGECDVVNPPCSDKCTRCVSSKTSSSGQGNSDKVTCPVCMAPNPSSQSTCLACLTPLSQ